MQSLIVAAAAARLAVSECLSAPIDLVPREGGRDSAGWFGCAPAKNGVAWSVVAAIWWQRKASVPVGLLRVRVLVCACVCVSP